MPEIEITENETEEITAADYLTNLQQVKDTMVSKDSYQKLQAENKKLADALMSGNFMTEEPKEKVDIQALRNKLFAPNSKTTTDLEMWTDMLTLRDAVMEAGEQDPFLPYNHDYIATAEDHDTAQRVADNIRECIEYADGDAAVFKNELQRRCGNNNKKR